VRLADDAVGADEVSDPSRIIVRRTAGSAIPEGDLPIRVGQERELEVVLVLEGGVGRAAVEADADDGGVLLLVVVREVPEPGTFRGSAGCIGFRIEPEDDVAPAVIAQSDLASFLIDCFEVGSAVARNGSRGAGGAGHEGRL